MCVTIEWFALETESRNNAASAENDGVNISGQRYNHPRRKLAKDFFNKDAQQLAQNLLGKVIVARYQQLQLAALVIETEAYYIDDKASHASLGFTQKRKALFMQPGTIYMYYARGGDSLNISARGDGNAVLIKSGFPCLSKNNGDNELAKMQQLNPHKNGQIRNKEKLCAGQTLLCKSLGLKVREWDQKEFQQGKFYLADVGYTAAKVIQTRRLGIPQGRDEDLMYRFIDYQHARYCTDNPLAKRSWQLGLDYLIHE